MERQQLMSLVDLLRRRATDSTAVEAKAAGGGLPKSVCETLSALSNGHGGTLILGLDERTGFSLVPGLAASRLRDGLARACVDDMEPPVRAEVEIVDLEDGQVVVAEVPELDPRFKPCFVKARGEYNGSFIRGGDGDRRLTDFEIHLLHTNRGQPDDDRTPVVGGRIEDLDSNEVAYLLRRVRQRQQRVFGDLDDTAVLRQLNIVTLDQDGRTVPTLAGMLALGTYPQHFFPQLNITFVVYPGISADAHIEGGPRFLDNRSFDGPIPVMVEDAVSAVMRNMSVRSFIEGVGRRDVFDYPVEAVREAIVNAIVHRDYSAYSRGAAIQVAMYPDRLVIGNPGGLFGAVTEDDLGSEGVSSTRNPVLVKLLQDVRLPASDRTVCENRGSGIPAMLREVRRIGSVPPEFQNRITRFKVVFAKHTLLDESTLAWLRSVGADGLSSVQQMALAMMRSGKQVSNQTLRNLGQDGRRATQELSDLVTRGLAVRLGERRHAKYLLAPGLAEGGDDGQDDDLLTAPAVEGTSGTSGSVASEGTVPQATEPNRTGEAVVLGVLSLTRGLRRQEIQDQTGMSRQAVLRALHRLVDLGLVVVHGARTSPHREYRRAA